VLSVATFAALASAALAPTASIALSIKPGSTFARSHAPVPQGFGGFVESGSTQGIFFGSGYEEWVQTLAEVPELSQAGGHPDSTISFQLEGVSNDPDGSAKDIFAQLSAGAVANPLVVPTCESADFHLTILGRCPTESQLGVAATDASPLRTLSPLNRLAPSPGEPLLLGFKALGVSVLMHPHVRIEGDYGLTVEARDLPTSQLGGTSLTLWGVPYDPIHDNHRFDTGLGVLGASVSGPVAPFTSAPTRCDTGPLRTVLRVRSWADAAQWDSEDASASEQTGCEQIEFDPEVTAEPTTDVADSPTGLNVDVHVPQNNQCEAGPPVECDLATSHLKDTMIALPEGMALNPSGANGLAGCSPAEIGLATPLGSKPIHFSGAPAACPDASKIGTAEVETPLLEAPLPGSVYIADPYDNPFGSMLAIYIEVDDQERGIVAKVAGQVAADQNTGQLVITVGDAPPLPIEHIRLSIKQGPHALLRTPTSCGEYSTTAELTPYAAPTSPVAVNDGWSIVRGPGGGCRQANAPSFDAGTVRPIAGVRSPFVASLRREDGTQQLKSFTMSLPPGLAADLSDSPVCPETSIAPRGAPPGDEHVPSHEGPTFCPPSSRVGSAFIGVGTGALPYFLDEGTIYLAGPYHGAPFSLVIVVPARAGPFDFGTVATRAAIFIDARTAQATIVVDPLPQILRGVPTSYRTVHLVLDRTGLIRNPTSCEPTQVTATATAVDGATAELSSRFQVADCAVLDFEPRLTVRLSGGLGRNGHPALHAVLRSGADEAGLRSAIFTLPAGELLDLRHVRALCDPQVPAELCPGSSRLGRVRLWSPLIATPLEGPIYLRTPPGRLPDLLADLHAGQLHILLHGHTVAPAGRFGIRFSALPDVPLSRGVFTLAGGRRGIVVNSEALCARHRRAEVSLSAHSGKRRLLRPKISLRGRC
jgi:hypothetical protein